MDLETLDRNSPQPLYEQIKDLIIDLIERTHLGANGQIPSERELIEQLQVNRLTVRKAIDALVQDGVLYRQHGKGTFVSPPKITQPLLVVRSFTEAMLQEGRVPGTRVYSVEYQSGSSRVCRHLQIGPATPVIKLVRIRYVDQVPLALITSYLPQDLTANLKLEDFEALSLYALLDKKCNIHLTKSTVSLEPTVANHQEAAILGVQPGLPLMLLTGVVFSKDNRVVEYSKALYRGDKVRFMVESE